MHVEILSDLPESWLEKEFVEREKKKKSLWGMVFRVLGHIRARGEDVTPLTKWRKSREERKTDCRKCSH